LVLRNRGIAPLGDDLPTVKLANEFAEQFQFFRTASTSDLLMTSFFVLGYVAEWNLASGTFACASAGGHLVSNPLGPAPSAAADSFGVTL
jgi:hypothetical protein